MILYTYHTPGFDIINQLSDYRKSSDYKDDLKIQNAYKKLSAIVKTDSFLWCTIDSDWYKTSIKRIRWKLDIPKCEIIKYINGNVWNLIIGNEPCPSHQLIIEWESECRKILNSTERKKVDSCVENKKKKWIDDLTPKNDLWNSLILDNNEDKHTQVLIPSPIKKEWLIEINEW